MYKNTIESLNPQHSTTRLVHRLLGSDYFDRNYRLKEDKKFNINIPRLGIYGSVLRDKPGSKIETRLFMPVGEGRQGEGGLRTKGYFKHSYEIRNGRWYATDAYGRRLMKVKPPCDFQIEAEQTYLPLVTVITVVLNGEKYLEETILSVINQTYPNVEYIIIDGGSTDSTLDIIRKYEDKIDYWISEKDKGIYDAMNKGIDLTAGCWMNFMNVGDSFLNESTVSKVMSYGACNNRGTSVLYGDHEVVYSDGRRRLKEAGKIDDIWKGSQFSHQSAFILSQEHKRCKFNVCNKISADFEFFYNLYIRKARFYHINYPVARVLAGGYSDTERIGSIMGWWSVIDDVKMGAYYAYLMFREMVKVPIKSILGRCSVNILSI